MRYAPHMSTRRETPFERRLREARTDPAYDKRYREAREEIDAKDRIVRELDAARVRMDLSKAELARRIGVPAESVRRLFTAKSLNPTATLLAKIASAVGCELRVVRRKGTD